VIDGFVVSVNVGKAGKVHGQDRNVTTGIFKEPVAGRVKVRRLGVEGDEQADPTVHGGPMKAVYAYPSEHYAYWKVELGREALPWGMFGENLTTQGLLENSVRIGDEFSIGTASMEITQPRFPCYKLGVKFETMEMVRRFQASGRCGFYLSVVKEGDLGAGDRIELIRRASSNPTISESFSSKLEE
jgi:MOSC domain-containing protein YiiM